MTRNRVALVAAGLAFVAGCTGRPVPEAGSRWEASPADALGPGTTRIVDVAPLPTGVIGVGSVTTDGRRVPAAWTSADGSAWTRLHTEPTSPYGFESELTTVAAEPDGRVAAI